MSVGMVISKRRSYTMVDLIAQEHGVAVEVLLVVGFSLLTAVSARIAIPLPFTPVPATAQTLVVLLAGAALGSRLGLLSQASYLLLGAAGLPVFSGGQSGLAQFASPTGGYLLGFLIAPFVVGLLAEHGWDREPLRAVGAMLAGSAIIYGTGVPWLAAALGLPIDRALALGLYPFLAADLVKLAFAAGALPGAWALIARWR